ncbi:MAG: adenosylcobalamin-dependent ribonucleoside-diphosphate reductase [Bacteroidetes bacterium]|nr:adenosylcobalamin-dependent ribonucleoside-diphosphate reductase [Bacteroidota bacterium]
MNHEQSSQTRLSENALKVLQQRYLRRRTESNVYESPDELFMRVAKSIAFAETQWGNLKDAEQWEEKFYNLMSKLLFLPNSPTLMNAGTPNGQLSACFVLPVEDSVNGIFTTLKNAALIQQSGGGTGFNFSHLRPREDIISSGGRSSGPVSFMKIFNAATEHVKLGGKRRGANMGVLHITHPDIEEFICSKKNDELSNFNISVAITDEFMYAVERNGMWKLIHPNTNKVIREIAARKLWKVIVENAWQCGDPGLIFIDTINRYNPTPAVGKIEATNPCGEVPLLSYEACNLGSVNLSKCITHHHTSKGIDWLILEEIVKTAIRFLDNVIEVNNYIIPEIKQMARDNRKIGLGVMGWADLLIQLEIPYDSEKAILLGERLMRFISQKSFEASVQLAVERGHFPNWKKSIYFHGIEIRNATRTSIAPTGTISIIADASSSIEPLFGLAFNRKHVLNDESLPYINPYFIQFLHSHKLYSDTIVSKVMNEGIAAHINELPEHTRNIFKTALEISPEWHLRNQLAFQKYTDNAVSKTINLPETITADEVDRVYKAAWQQGAKGITVFRQRSKNKQVFEQGIQPEIIKGCKVCIN